MEENREVQQQLLAAIQLLSGNGEPEEAADLFVTEPRKIQEPSVVPPPTWQRVKMYMDFYYRPCELLQTLPLSK